jgi:hypothetical protein
MITSKGKLTFGSIYDKFANDNLCVSEKFISVKKIVSTNNMCYILENGNIYYNTTLSNDNFKIILQEGNEHIEFIDIDVSNKKLFALDTNSTIYETIHDATLTKCNYNFNNIINIYGSCTQYLILKDTSRNYYVLSNINNSYNLVFLGNADCIYFTLKGIVLIDDNNITIVTIASDFIIREKKKSDDVLLLLSTLYHNFDHLRQIPNGSYLKFCHGGQINLLPTDTNDTILFSFYTFSKNLCICSITNNIYTNNIYTNFVGEIPKLKNLFTSIKHNRRSNVKNAMIRTYDK